MSALRVTVVAREKGPGLPRGVVLPALRGSFQSHIDPIIIAAGAGNPTGRTDGRPVKLLAMDARSYAVVLEPGPEEGYSAHIPAFRGAHTQGETVEEALLNAGDVIAGYIEILADRGEPVPPSDLATPVAITDPGRVARARDRR